MLLRIPQALQPDELAQVRQLILAADWADGRITAGSQSGAVKLNLQLPEDLPAAQQARHIVSRALARNPQFVTGALPKSVYPPLFNRYGGSSNYFGDHIDNAVRIIPESRDAIHHAIKMGRKGELVVTLADLVPDDIGYVQEFRDIVNMKNAN